MKQFKFYTVISIFMFLLSCGSIKDGFSSQKKNNNDEFLVEKKSPLVMPPDYNELPVPSEEKIEDETDGIKSLISKSKNDENNEVLDEKNSTFESSILKKIKKD